jgi:hypothetical protein
MRGTKWEQRYAAPESCLQAQTLVAERPASEVELLELRLDEALADIAAVKQRGRSRGVPGP